jgi:hypothetical protein
MKTSEKQFLPCGLSGIMSYDHVKVGSYKVELNAQATIDGLYCNVIVDEVSKDGLSFHIESNVDNVCEEVNKNFLFQLQLLDYAQVLGEQRLVYYK